MENQEDRAPFAGRKAVSQKTYRIRTLSSYIRTRAIVAAAAITYLLVIALLLTDCDSILLMGCPMPTGQESVGSISLVFSVQIKNGSKRIISIVGLGLMN